MSSMERSSRSNERRSRSKTIYYGRLNNTRSARTRSKSRVFEAGEEIDESDIETDSQGSDSEDDDITVADLSDTEEDRSMAVRGKGGAFEQRKT